MFCTSALRVQESDGVRMSTCMSKHRRALRFALTALLATVLAGMAFANDELLKLQQDPGQFVMPNANYSGTNFSSLDKINRHNVDQLKVAWTFQTGVLDSHEAQPLVIGTTMYLMTPKPNTVIALDLVNRGTIKWAFEPEMDTERAGALACCGAQSRGLAYGDGRLFFVTLDGQLFSLSIGQGRPWTVQSIRWCPLCLCLIHHGAVANVAYAHHNSNRNVLDE